MRVSRIEVCGPLAVEVDGTPVTLPGLKGGLVVAYLAVHRARPVTRDELAAALWPETSPADPVEALAALLSKVRRALGREVLEGRRELQLVFADGVRTDWERAGIAVRAGRMALEASDRAAARTHAAEALAIAERGFLSGHEGPWVEERRRELADLRIEALELAASGGDEPAARALVEAAPFRESGHRLLMEAHAARGDVAEALRAYERLRVLLRDELGATPAAEVQALHARLLRGETGGGAPPRGASAPDFAGGGREGRLGEESPGEALPPVLAPRRRSAFVGRTAELEVLLDGWRDALRGRRRLIVVSGEPGIGKTRLAGELASAVGGDGMVLYAGCQEDALVSYQPFVEALKPVAPFPAPSGASDDPGTLRYLLFEAVADLLADLAGRQPVVLLLDDLHWADRATLHLLRHVMRAPRDAALLVVGTYREAEVDTAHPLAELLADLRRERLVARVALRGLADEAVRELADAQAGRALPEDVVDRVRERTEGNPFFVEELVQHFVETDGLRSCVTDVPEGVKEVLEQRLGRLAAPSREVLAQAAVLGRRFTFPVLVAMTGRDEDEVIAALEEAVAAQLVFEAGDGPVPAHAFRHALVRETLYGALSTPRRQKLHASAAAALGGGEMRGGGAEKGEGGAEAAAIAVHLRLAGAAADPEAAVMWSLRAGEEARVLAAWDEAAEHWEGAADVLARVPGREAERARLLVALADLMVVAGDLGRQIAFLEAALEALERLGDEARAARVHSRLGMAHALIDSIAAEHMDIGAAFRHFDAARRVLDREPASRARGHLETGVSAALTYGLRIPEGGEAGARAMEIGERIGDELLWASGAECLGWHKIIGGELAEGFGLNDRAFEAADRHRQTFVAWMAANTSGQLSWGLGAPDEAQAHLERPLDLAYFGKTTYRREIADGVGRCHLSRGEVEDARAQLGDARASWASHALKPLLDLWEGRWDQVEALAAEILATSRRSGNRWDEWASQHLAARVHTLRGNAEVALPLLDRALEIVVDGGATYFELWVRGDRALVLAGDGRTAEAREDVDRCREITGNGEDWRGRLGHVALAEAVAGGDETAFATARDIFAARRLRGDEAETLLHWGRALGGDAGREKLDEAAEILRACGAGRPWLDRLREEARL